MSRRRLKLDPDEHARRGTEVYEQEVLPQLQDRDHGKVVALDIDSGAFVVADNTVEASDRLLEKVPDARIWFVRVGHRAVHRFGPRLVTERT